MKDVKIDSKTENEEKNTSKKIIILSHLKTSPDPENMIDIEEEIDSKTNNKVGQSYEVNVNLENQTKVSRDCNTINLDCEVTTKLKEQAKTEVRSILEEPRNFLLKGQELVNYLQKVRKNKKQLTLLVGKTSDTSQPTNSEELDLNIERKNPEKIGELNKTNTVEMSTKTDKKSIEVELCEKDDVAEEMKKANTVEMSTKIDTITKEMEFSDNDTDTAILAELQATSEGSSISDDLNVDKLTLIPPEVSRKTL